MSASAWRSRPAPEDPAAASGILLSGLARDAALPDLLGELEPLCLDRNPKEEQR